MRIHGVHLNGLDSPRGAHQLACEPGYNVVVCPDARAAERLMAVVRALLCDPGELQGNGRADVSLSLGRDAYRIVADLAGRRVALVRYEQGAGPRRVASGPAEILRVLRDAGLPDAPDLEQLCVWPPPDHWPDLEGRVKELESAFGEFEPIAHELDGLEARVESYRTEHAERERTRCSIDVHRSALEDDRRKLRAPVGRLALAWSGVALGFGAAAAGLQLAAGFWALAALGVCVAAGGSLAVRSARRGVGRVESRLAALRSAEREAERRFDAEAGGVRELLQSLDLDSPEALLRVADGYRRAAHELEETRAQLERAGRSRPAETPAATPGTDPLERMVEAAARARGTDAEDLRRRLAPVLPVYLRALSGGSWAKARRDADGGWWIHPASGEPPTRPDALGEADHERVCLAFRLALLEALAPQLRMPLLVGPGPGQGRALARSLRRLGSVGQVIHFCTSEGEASEHAHGVHHV